MAVDTDERLERLQDAIENAITVEQLELAKAKLAAYQQSQE